MKQKGSNGKATQPLADKLKSTPSEFDEVYSFNENFPHVPNALFANKERRLFLGRHGEDNFEKLREVSLVEALEWYVRCMDFSEGGSGSVVLLCGMAAERLKN